jgi:alpha-2-macroglobulin
VAEALSIQPKALYELSWKEPNLALLELKNALLPGQRYQFTLASTAFDRRGVALHQDLRWEYWLPEWQVEMVSSPSLKNKNSPIRLKFSQGVDKQSVEGALHIEPAVNISLSWKNDQELTLTAEDAFPPGQIYTLRFAGQINDSEGFPLPALDPLTVVTPPPIRNLRPAEGAENISPNARIQITFDRLMDQEKTQTALSFDPALEGEFTWDDNTLSFRPNTNLSDFTTYTVTLSTEAAGENGEPVLLEPYSWFFTTSMLGINGQKFASFGDYGPNAQVLDLDGPRALQFLATEATKEVTFSIHRLSLEQFLDRYASGFRGVAGSERKAISLEGTETAAAWAVDTSGKGAGWAENVYESRVPPEIPAGLYILDMKIDETSQGQLILILTRYTLLVKEAKGEIIVWASDINGGSLPGIDVSIFARDGSLIRSGTADAQGVYKTKVERDPQPLIVVAQRGGDITVSGLSNEWSGRGGWWWGWWLTPAADPVDYRGYVYTDRPIYRPGQSVYFKAVLRNDDDVVYSLPEEEFPVTVRIRDARDNVVQTFEMISNALGTVNGEFLLADGAMLGSYFVEAEIGGERFRQIFKVEDYRKPDYQVSLSPDAAKYTMGDEIRVTIKASYYFGEPVVDAPVVVKRFYLESNYYEWGVSIQGSDQEYTWYPDGGFSLRGRTDENGFFTFTVPADIWEGNEYYDTETNFKETIWGFEAEIDDGSRQEVTGFTVVKVANIDQKLEIETGSFLQRPEEPFTVHARAVSLSGAPIAGKPLLLELRRWETNSYRYNTVVQSQDFTTGANGRGSLSFTINQPGYYQLRVSGEDSRGYAIIRSTWIYAYRGEGSWFYDQSSFRISAEKDSYQPGETATLIIEAQQAGQALLTFERGRVHREQFITLTPPVTLVPVQIFESDAPNIFVTVNAWESKDNQLEGNEIYQSLSDSKLNSASFSLKVSVSRKKLQVEILPDKERYAPREQAGFTVQVTTEDGRPARAEVSLALVDEAIFALSQDLTKPAFEAFYAQRSNRVKTYNSMALTRELFLGGMGGGGGDESGGGPRSDFRDTAAWFPALLTDQNGLVHVNVVLPDNLTNWRLTARAVTAATEVGEAILNVITHQEIVARPFLPRSLTSGDEVSLSAAVHNYAAEPRTLHVTLSSADVQVLRLSDATTQTVTLAPGEVRLFTWKAEALNSGEAQLTLQAAAVEGSGDSIRLPLPISALAVPDLSFRVSTFEKDYYTTFVLPEGALPSSRVDIEISRSIAGSLLDGLEYLTGYPYGCVEQTMSRALPNAVVARAFRKLGAANETLEADLPPLINAGLQRLYGYQHNDGGWGWWYDDSTDAFQTAWVVFGLAVTAEAGYEVEESVIARGVQWLDSNLGEMEPRLQAYALYSMASAGQGNLEAALQLAGRAYTLDTFSQSALALALDKMNDRAAARQVLNLVYESARVKDSAVFWPQPDDQDNFYLRTMASTRRSTALALSALSQIDPTSHLIPGAAGWLMSQRRLNGWGNTNETSYAVIALSDYLLSTYSAGGDTSVLLELNGLPLKQGELSGVSTGSQGVFKISIPMEQMVPGVNLLKVSQTGSGLLYAAARARFELPQDDLPAAGMISLTREYLAPKGRDLLTEFVPGQLVRVRLTINTDQQVNFAILEDHLPGGLEALNESLNTTTHLHVSDYSEPTYTWRQYGYNNKEIYGSRVSFFITEIRKGTHMIEYLARATFSGTFLALPAEIYAMYDESIWGRSDSVWMQVGD